MKKQYYWELRLCVWQVVAHLQKKMLFRDCRQTRYRYLPLRISSWKCVQLGEKDGIVIRT